MPEPAPRPHRRENGEARQRRDLATGESRDEAELIRFVVGPDGPVTPDLARRLPGRGLWVGADRASIEAAVRRRAFARAAKAPVGVAADLADRIEALMRTRLLAGLGLARKAGALVCGFEKVLESVRAGRAAVLIEASDGAADGRRKLLGAAAKALPRPLIVGMFACEDLSLALGAENVIHSAFLAGRGAEGWTSDVRRLSGFSPLLPDGWREDP